MINGVSRPESFHSRYISTTARRPLRHPPADAPVTSTPPVRINYCVINIGPVDVEISYIIQFQSFCLSEV